MVPIEGFERFNLSVTNCVSTQEASASLCPGILTQLCC